MSELDDPRQQLVAIRKDVGADRDLLADGALDRKSAAVDLRPDTLDDNAATRADVTRAGNHGALLLDSDS